MERISNNNSDEDETNPKIVALSESEAFYYFSFIITTGHYNISLNTTIWLLTIFALILSLSLYCWNSKIVQKRFGIFFFSLLDGSMVQWWDAWIVVFFKWNTHTGHCVC